MQINSPAGSVTPGSGKNQKFSFCKDERLCSVKIISDLFETGNVFHNTLYKVVWKYSAIELPYPAQVAFSVSKRSFKHAVKRNLVRRRMREAYRKNKHCLYDRLELVKRQMVFTIIFKGSSIQSYDIIEKSMKGVITTLIKSTEA